MNIRDNYATATGFCVLLEHSLHTACTTVLRNISWGAGITILYYSLCVAVVAYAVFPDTMIILILILPMIQFNIRKSIPGIYHESNSM